MNSRPPLAKSFAGDDPDRLAEIRKESFREKEEAKPPRKKITVPKNAEETKGLVLSLRVEAATVDGSAPKEAEVVAGNPLFLRPIVRNTSNTPAPVSYTSEKRFDVIIFADQGQKKPVYVWSADKIFAPIYVDRMLSANTTTSSLIEIPTTTVAQEIPDDGRENLTEPLPPGEYYAWATHEATPFLAAGPLKITVEAPPEEEKKPEEEPPEETPPPSDGATEN